jgi:hypothetical protein
MERDGLFVGTAVLVFQRRNLGKTLKISARIAGNPAKIQTGYLLNTCPEHCRYMKLVGARMVKNHK